MRLRTSAIRLDRDMSVRTIFSKRPWLRLQLGICVALALCLLVMGQLSIPIAQRLRQWSTELAIPVQKIAYAPFQFVDQAKSALASHQRLISDNARLRAHQFMLRAHLHQLLRLEQENLELRALLGSRSKLTGTMTVAQLLAVNQDQSVHEILVDKGRHQGVFLGQPVVDAFGVIGQVVKLGEDASYVLQLIDTRSAIPVETIASGWRGIAIGEPNHGYLVVQNVPETLLFKPGDLFVTSGLGQRYPVGYPVGTVLHVEHVAGDHSNQLILAPAAHLHQSRQVLLVWPAHRPTAKDALRTSS